jgi:hypothetical protein
VSCSYVREELGAYVLDALEPSERESVAQHLARCPACAAEYGRLAGLPALLSHAEGLEIPDAPHEVEERVLDQIARERGAARRARRGWIPRWPRTRTLLAGALAGAALGAGVTALVLAGDDSAQPSRSYQLVLRGEGDATARAQLSPGSEGTEVHLWVDGLPPGGETVYEVLCERPGWSASAGTFRADARGKAYAVLTTAARVGEYERIRVLRRSDDNAVLSGRLE